ncbi:MAG: MFS transporter [Halanaerobiaceae bacterium]
MKYSKVLNSNIAILSVTHGVNHGFLLFFTPLITLLINDLNLNYAAIGSLITFMYIAFGIIPLPAGLISDRIGRKTMALISLILPSIGAFLGALANSYWTIAITFIIIGIGSGFYHPVGYALVTGLVGEKSRGKALGIHGVGGNIGQAITPALAGLIASLWNWRLAFVIWGFAGIVNAVLLFRILPGQKQEYNDKETSNTTASMKKLLNLTIIIVLIILAIQGFVNDGIFSFLPTFLQTQFGLGIAISGLITALNYGIGAIGQLSGGYFSDKYGRVAVLIWGTVGCIFSLMILPFTESNVLMVICISIMGFSLFMLQPAINALVGDVTPQALLGSSFGIVFIAKYGVGALAPAVAGYFAQVSLLSYFFILMAVLMIVSLVFVLILNN